jgi:hypothetical protein
VLFKSLFSADPDDVSAQIDLIGAPWLVTGEEPSAAPIGGDARCATVEAGSPGVTASLAAGARYSPTPCR